MDPGFSRDSAGKTHPAAKAGIHLSLFFSIFEADNTGIFLLAESALKLLILVRMCYQGRNFECSRQVLFSFTNRESQVYSKMLPFL